MPCCCTANTLKIGVIDVTDFDGDFTFELFRRTLRRRLHLLDPLRYKLVDIPLKLHHPMWRDHFEQFATLPRLLRESAAGVSRVRRRAKERGRHPELARNFAPPPTFINHVVSPGRRFATATLALADVKQTSEHLGITINDLVLATAAGALRELLLRYDGRADEPLLTSLPASLG